MELRRFRMKGKNDPGEFFAWCAKKGLSREDLVLILASVELDTSVGVLPEYLYKEESESVGQMKFETYQQSVLTDAQIGLLKEALQDGRYVYFYGLEGTGKTVLCRVFRENGFINIDEPGRHPSWGEFTLPNVPFGVVLMELYGLKKRLDVSEVLGFSGSDIVAWLKA